MNFGGRSNIKELKTKTIFLLKDTWDAVYGNVSFFTQILKQ